ncbi:helix-turn-helix domain-containing protein [Sphaerisporangium sp. NPDC088356]|uniref:helix-turn-helix domain-containing protein n=1 Tax=Sphaerisporangium sp. NPDC088356 TaxID=3154871 RepID=UPI00342CF4AF
MRRKENPRDRRTALAKVSVMCGTLDFMSPPATLSIGDCIRERRQQAHLSLRQLADASGISNPYLSQIERGQRTPSAEVVGQIARGLGITAGSLLTMTAGNSDGNHSSDVLTAIRADSLLDERQRQILIEVYTSFCRVSLSRTGADSNATHVAPSMARWEGETLFDVEEFYPSDVIDGEAETGAEVTSGFEGESFGNLDVESPGLKEFLEALSSR